MSAENMETKEDIKKIIDKSTDYGELYKNSLGVLKRMESTFKDTLRWIANKEWWDWKKEEMINKSVFDDRLNTNNPITMFEKKWAELLKRSKDIAENNRVLNKWIQIAKSLWIKRLDQKWKDVIINELFKTRQDAIQDFKRDVADGMLSNENNIDMWKLKGLGSNFWRQIFDEKNGNSKGFNDYIEKFSLPDLMFWTFNIEEWSWAFISCFKKIKEKLWNQSLFDYIDSLKKTWGDQFPEALKYSSLRMLLKRWKTSELINWINWYKWDKKQLLQYIKNKTLKDRDFKIWFLGSITKLEKYKWFFKNLAEDVKKDPKVREAYARALRVNNADIFKSKKMDALAIYDDEGHGGGGDFFKSELAWYQKKGFLIENMVTERNYTKYVLKNSKTGDMITMVQLKNIYDLDEDLKWDWEKKEKGLIEAIQKKKNWQVANILKPIIDGKNYNLFALRWHCYNTDNIAYSLWHLGAVEEGDILIDWWCWNAEKTWVYHVAWVKWQTFAYTEEWRWASTQSFIDRVINAKSNEGWMSSVLWYYNGKTDAWIESWSDWYFAAFTERPDSVAAQYKILTTK